MPDYNGRKYKYVFKKELKPVKSQMNYLITQLQNKLESEGVVFKFNLIGSGRNYKKMQI